MLSSYEKQTYTPAQCTQDAVVMRDSDSIIQESIFFLWINRFIEQFFKRAIICNRLFFIVPNSCESQSIYRFSIKAKEWARSSWQSS